MTQREKAHEILTLFGYQTMADNDRLELPDYMNEYEQVICLTPKTTMERMVEKIIANIYSRGQFDGRFEIQNGIKKLLEM